MIEKLVLLPGMDGTGDLFADFVRALPVKFDAVTVRYPIDRRLTYVELESIAEAAFPEREPFVLLAESFSTPLAIQIAALNPPNMRGLVLCAGFARSPVQGWKRYISALIARIVTRIQLPGLALTHFLVGPNALKLLLSSVRVAISRVEPDVLSFRLRSVLGCDVRRELNRVAVPILCLRAKNDRLVPEWCAEEIRCTSAHAIIETIDGPHLLLQREPEKSAAAITWFVQQLK